MTNREKYKDEIKGYAEDDMILTFIRKHGIADTNKMYLTSALALFIMWLDEEYKEPKHDGCVGCKYDYKETDEYPCVVCKQSFKDRYELDT